jgi:hypothetical protein
VAIAAAAAAVGLLTAASAAEAALFFHSPSGNIGCGISRHGARCDIADHAWRAPPKPASCHLDWGYGLTVGRHGAAGFFCASDSVLHLGRKLGYGQKVRRGRFKCASRTDGVRCVNTRNHHGFKLSREHANRF